MKRTTCYDVPSLDELLTLAASFDDGRLMLDPYEIHELLSRLLLDAQTKLGENSELRLGSASLQKSSSGTVTVRLKRCDLSLQSPCPQNKQAA